MELIPNEGISITSIYRGLIGVTSIIAIAYLLSSNRKMIDWNTIFIGLASQFIIAIGVIKVDFVRKVVNGGHVWRFDIICVCVLLR